MLLGDVCALKISLAPPLFIEVPVPSLESERLCNIVVGCRFCSHNAFVPPVTLVLFMAVKTIAYRQPLARFDSV